MLFPSAPPSPTPRCSDPPPPRASHCQTLLTVYRNAQNTVTPMRTPKLVCSVQILTSYAWANLRGGNVVTSPLLVPNSPVKERPQKKESRLPDRTKPQSTSIVFKTAIFNFFNCADELLTAHLLFVTFEINPLQGPANSSSTDCYIRLK